MSASLRDIPRAFPFFLSRTRPSSDRPRNQRTDMLRPGQRVLAEVPIGGDGEGTRTVWATAIDEVTIRDDDGHERCLFRILKRFF